MTRNEEHRQQTEYNMENWKNQLNDFEMDTIENIVYDIVGWDRADWSSPMWPNWTDGYELSRSDVIKIEDEIKFELGLKAEVDPYSASIKLTR